MAVGRVFVAGPTTRGGASSLARACAARCDATARAGCSAARFSTSFRTDAATARRFALPMRRFRDVFRHAERALRSLARAVFAAPFCGCRFCRRPGAALPEAPRACEDVLPSQPSLSSSSLPLLKNTALSIETRGGSTFPARFLKPGKCSH